MLSITQLVETYPFELKQCVLARKCFIYVSKVPVETGFVCD
jgi:hypothetical protein